MATIGAEELVRSEKSNECTMIPQENSGTPTTKNSEIMFSFKSPKTKQLPSLNNICSILSNNF